MNIFLTPKEIRERSRDLGRTNLLFIFGIIKAASIGVAVTVFLQIFIDLSPTWEWESIWSHLPLFLLWTVSYLCLLVTYDGALFATVFLIHVPKKSETFFTFLLVGTEALQFAILSPSLISNKDNSRIMSVHIHEWWYVIFCFYCIFMYFLVHFGKIEIQKSKYDFVENLQPIISKYIVSFNNAKMFIGLAFFISALTFISLLPNPFTDNGFRYGIHIISAIILLAINFTAFFMQHIQRNSIEKMFKNLDTEL